MRDYCHTKREDLLACHRMTESTFQDCKDVGLVIIEICKKLKHDIEAMKKQNREDMLNAHMAKVKEDNKELLESLDLK